MIDRAMRPYKYRHIGDRLLARWEAGQAERDVNRAEAHATFDKARDAALARIWGDAS